MYPIVYDLLRLTKCHKKYQKFEDLHMQVDFLLPLNDRYKSIIMNVELFSQPIEKVYLH